MTFVVMGLGTVFNALTNRRDPASGLSAPLLKALAISARPGGMIVLATELPGLQKGLLTTSLTGQRVARVPRARRAAAARGRDGQVDPQARRSAGRTCRCPQALAPARAS